MSPAAAVDLQALQDKQEITEICYRYGLALDRRDWAALAAAVRPGDPEAAAAFVRHLDSPRRVVLEVAPEGRIGFDSTQMWRDTPDAARRD